MAFTEKLPEWQAEGIEPPDSKKQTGWEVEDKPPAGWWNWILNRTFKVLEELRNKAADKEYVDNAVAGVKVPDASLTQKGVTQLSSATNSTSETMAATPKAVKTVSDAAAAAQTKADAAETPSGAQAKANTAETNAKNYVDGKPWQKTKLTADDGKCILLPAGTNLNTVVKNGFYNGNNLQNAPTTTDWWYIEVLEHTNGDTYAIQKAYSFYSLTFYMRIMQNGVWGAWSQDLFTSVANGKSSIATAISGKGVPTSPTDSFATMAANIGLINTGKRFATGTYTIPDNNTQGFTISGLAFTPSIVIAKRQGTIGTATESGLIWSGKAAFTYTGTQPYYLSSINGNSFSMRNITSINAAGQVFDWIAIE
ncbi:pyocin knob domain-containing protein [Paenibacillus cellulositrophicus]|uniref:pyocin knob domain-containing protein n=1 Tax=Paenibacillus cellulositrophicus TaxID=562959 RepID=UPI003F7F908E